MEKHHAPEKTLHKQLFSKLLFKLANIDFLIWMIFCGIATKIRNTVKHWNYLMKCVFIVKCYALLCFHFFRLSKELSSFFLAQKGRSTFTPLLDSSVHLCLGDIYNSALDKTIRFLDAEITDHKTKQQPRAWWYFGEAPEPGYISNNSILLCLVMLIIYDKSNPILSNPIYSHPICSYPTYSSLTLTVLRPS